MWTYRSPWCVIHLSWRPSFCKKVSGRLGKDLSLASGLEGFRMLTSWKIKTNFIENFWEKINMLTSLTKWIDSVASLDEQNICQLEKWQKSRLFASHSTFKAWNWNCLSHTSSSDDFYPFFQNNDVYIGGSLGPNMASLGSLLCQSVLPTLTFFKNSWKIY